MTWLYIPETSSPSAPGSAEDLMTDARAKQAKRMREWRARNRGWVSADNQKRHAQNREAILSRKRAYYQEVRKSADKTEAGRLAERNKKARRRSATKTGNVTIEEWEAILKAHGYACAYCHTTEAALEMDHITALSKGGQHCATNIAPACKPCNSRKGNR